MSLRVEVIQGEERRSFDTEATISIGRSEESTVVLPGLYVARRHIEIAQQDGGALHLRCKSPLGVVRNGKTVREDCDLQPGDRLEIAGHQLLLTMDPGSKETLLRITVDTGAASGTAGDRRLDLRAAGLRMRRPALIAAAAVLLLMLVVPLLLRAVAVPPVVETVLPIDDWWSSGRLSNAHQHFAEDCGSCHLQLFRRVPDKACMDCHEGIAHHSDMVAEAGLSSLDEQRCASCHREHGGAHAVLPEHPGTCVDCHGDPEAFPVSTELRRITAFEDHPSFRATVTRREGAELGTARLLLSEAPADETGLVFPHDVHLDEEGVLGPDGPEQLACSSCHRPDAGEVGFRAIRFERDCQSCHQLDLVVGEDLLRLPHAEPAAVRQQVRSAVAALPEGAFSRRPDSSARRRAGAEAERGGPVSADALVAEVFSTRVCAKCHEPAEDAEGLPDVQPVRLRSSWLVHARFTHADHGWVSCGDCHAARDSEDADELLLPDLATCRSCHAGVASSRGVRSACIDCHGFHVAHDTVMGWAQGDNQHEPMGSTGD
ncbi:FHA domain-containing protein [Algiphilus aromaticivorans]|uniref:FHA domain-containing protein n=1 Tax=Algiphilus aromaticivorans TaxID=382454 RepID=UPI0005C19319|nr:FHA domain-containing protein [Algiphilus aromaticivorans]